MRRFVTAMSLPLLLAACSVEQEAVAEQPDSAAYGVTVQIEVRPLSMGVVSSAQNNDLSLVRFRTAADAINTHLIDGDRRCAAGDTTQAFGAYRKARELASRAAEAYTDQEYVRIFEEAVRGADLRAGECRKGF